MTVLLNGVSSNQEGSGVAGTGSAVALAVYATGSFGGGQVEIQVSPDGGTTWIPLTLPNGSIASFSANTAGWMIDSIPTTWQLRAVLQGADTPAGVYAEVE